MIQFWLFRHLKAGYLLTECLSRPCLHYKAMVLECKSLFSSFGYFKSHCPLLGLCFSVFKENIKYNWRVLCWGQNKLGFAYNSEKTERCWPWPPHALFLFEVCVEWLIVYECMYGQGHKRWIYINRSLLVWMESWCLDLQVLVYVQSKQLFQDNKVVLENTFSFFIWP